MPRAWEPQSAGQPSLLRPWHLGVRGAPDHREAKRRLHSGQPKHRGWDALNELNWLGLLVASAWEAHS